MFGQFNERNEAGAKCVTALQLGKEEFESLAVGFEESFLAAAVSDKCDPSEKYHKLFNEYILAEDSEREVLDKYLTILSGNTMLNLLNLAKERNRAA